MMQFELSLRLLFVLHVLLKYTVRYFLCSSVKIKQELITIEEAETKRKVFFSSAASLISKQENTINLELMKETTKQASCPASPRRKYRGIMTLEPQQDTSYADDHTVFLFSHQE